VPQPLDESFGNLVLGIMLDATQSAQSSTESVPNEELELLRHIEVARVHAFLDALGGVVDEGWKFTPLNVKGGTPSHMALVNDSGGVIFTMDKQTFDVIQRRTPAERFVELMDEG
jgi:hypothetical protein